MIKFLAKIENNVFSKLMIKLEVPPLKFDSSLFVDIKKRYDAHVTVVRNFKETKTKEKKENSQSEKDYKSLTEKNGMTKKKESKINQDFYFTLSEVEALKETTSSFKYILYQKLLLHAETPAELEDLLTNL